MLYCLNEPQCLSFLDNYSMFETYTCTSSVSIDERQTNMHIHTHNRPQRGEKGYPPPPPHQNGSVYHYLVTIPALVLLKRHDEAQ